MPLLFEFNAVKIFKFISYHFRQKVKLPDCRKIVFLSVIICFISILSPGLQAQSDSLKSDSTQVLFEMQKSPWGAVLRSAIVPGLGQIYNESYYKAPIIWALGGWLIYNWVNNNNLKNDYAELFIQTGNESYRFLRTTYQDRRDEFAIYIGLVYLLNLVDAYVDAHLFDFSVDDLNSPGESALRLSLRINF